MIGGLLVGFGLFALVLWLIWESVNSDEFWD